MTEDQAELDRINHDIACATPRRSSRRPKSSPPSSATPARASPVLLRTAKKNNASGRSSIDAVHEDAASVLYRLSGGIMGIKGDDSDDEITGGAIPQDSCADSEDTLTPLERSVTRRRLGGAEEKLATEYLDELCCHRKMPRIEITTIDRMGGPLKW